MLRATALVYADPSALPKSVPALKTRRDFSFTRIEMSSSVLSAGRAVSGRGASDRKTPNPSSLKMSFE
jgi:hypothetical protein